MIAPSTLGDWPVFGLVEDVRPAVARACASGLAMALATVRAAEGGAPRGLGAQMLVIGAGEAVGYLAGGCIEADVVGHAQAVMAEGAARVLIYGQGGPIDLPLPCGGFIEVLVEPLDPDAPAVRALAGSTARRRPGAWITDGTTQSWSDNPAADEGLVRWYDPPLRLVITGGDPTALALAGLAARSGIESRLIRPGGPATPPPLEGVAYDIRPIGEALAAAAIDPWTALVAAGHDSETDEAAALHALGLDAFYVGGVGSRRRGTLLRRSLVDAGADPADAERFHMPAGLPTFGRAPFAIALSVLAEIVKTDQETRAERRRAP